MEKDFYEELQEKRMKAQRQKEEEARAAKIFGNNGIHTVRTSWSHMYKEDFGDRLNRTVVDSSVIMKRQFFNDPKLTQKINIGDQFFDKGIR